MSLSTIPHLRRRVLQIGLKKLIAAVASATALFPVVRSTRLHATLGTRRSLALLLVAVLFSATVAAHLAVSTSAATQTDLWIPPNKLESFGPGSTVAGVTEISLTTKHIVYDEARQILYASVPANAPTQSNSIVSINAHSGSLGPPISIGTNPGRLVLSKNGEYLFASLDGSGSVQRFELASHALGPEFNLGINELGDINLAEDMESVPGQPMSLAISTEGNFNHSGVAIYDNGVRRANQIGRNIQINLIEFGANASILYGVNNKNTEAGFRTLAVDNNGVSLASTISYALGSPRELEFLNGLLYTNDGLIYDPEKQELVGKFPLPNGGSSVALDPAAGRAYFISGTGSYEVLVAAYNLSNFAQVSSLKIPLGYSSTPYTLEDLTLCGTGTLAFRIDDRFNTGNHRVFLVQTAALNQVPTAPVPTPVLEADNLIKLDLAANDLIFDPGTQKIYASVPGSAGSFGNSILPIDPSSGSPGTPVFVGSEPAKLAISDNHQYLYAGLNGAAAVRRFDLASQSAGKQFSLGFSTGGNGPLYANDIGVQPGNPTAVVVARRNNTLGSDSRDEDVALFADGQLRPKFTDIFHRTPFIEFSSSPSLLYGFGYGAYQEYVLKFGVDDSGVSFQSSLPGITFGAKDIKFDNGLLYSTTGQVFDPEAGQMVAEFPTNGLVVPDSAGGRVYFIESVPSLSPVATILAFDLQTFVPVGFLEVTIAGGPTSLIRCGNGLAFSTSGNQVFIVPLSSLHPYDIPSPTVTERSDGIKSLSLPANDLVYSPQDQRIYASVPGYAGSIGNSITSIDPQTASVLQTVHVGSEPGRLAISEAGDTIYTALRGSGSIRRFDVATNSAGLQFGLGRTTGSGLRYAENLAVAPDNPNLVAVSHFELDILGGRGVGLYENGVKRPNEAAGNSLAFSGAHLYTYSNDTSEFGLRKLGVSANGLSEEGIAGLISGWGHTIKSAGGVIYGTDGTIVEAETLSLMGKFSRKDGGIWMAPDPGNHRVYFLTFDVGKSLNIIAYDSETYMELGLLKIENIRSDQYTNVRSFIRYGPEGLAFNTSDGRIHFLKTSMIQPSVSTPVPTPVQVSVDVKRVPLSTGDIVYNRSDGMIYASVPSRTALGAPITFGNSIVPINPLTGAVGTPVYAGSEPKKLAISGDGQFIYAGLDGAGAVTRFDTTTKTMGAKFSLGIEISVARFVEDMEVAPGTNGTLAISTRHNGGSPGHIAVAIYDHGIQRPKKADGQRWGHLNNVIEYSSSASTLYGYDIENSYRAFHRLTVDDAGAETVTASRNILEGKDIKFDNGLIYESMGRVLNPETGALVGRFTGPGLSPYTSLVLPESATGRVFFLVEDRGVISTNAVIRAYDQKTFGLIGTMTIPGIAGDIGSFIRWGTNGFAFRTTVQNKGSELYFVQWPTSMPTTAPPPSPTPTPTPPPVPQFGYSISGSITDAFNNPIVGANILIEMKDFQGASSTRTTTTAATGYYASGDLGCQDNVKVTPSKAGYSFSLQSDARTSSGYCFVGQDWVYFKATATAAPSPSPSPGAPAVLTADQVAEMKAWTVGGRTSVYVKPQFPDAGYRVANWGQPVMSGNDFTVDASVEKLIGSSIQAKVTTAQIYDLGPLADGTYNFNFKTSGTLAKTLQFIVSSTASLPNPVDSAREFVKQQYRDFLNREADQAGEDFWTDNITKCTDPARRSPGQAEAECTSRQRELTSGAFFLSPESQYTGYYVYRMYQGALGRQPKLSEFTTDAQVVGNGIIINGQLSAAKINQNKSDFAATFVNCTDAAKSRCGEFKAIYDGLSNQEYVNKLFLNTGANASAEERTMLIYGLNANPATETRASVLQKVVDGINVISEGNQQFTTTYGQAFYNSEFKRAFVQLEYFGYMKRDPDEAGYAFWLGKLNTFGGDFVAAEMVLAFISSPEYRARFGQP